MDCIECNGSTKVYDTVPYQGIVYRRRRCLVCGAKFFTMEDIVSADDKNLRRAIYYKNYKSERRFIYDD